MNTTLASARLLLRPCALTDVELLVQHWSQPGVRRYLFDDRATNHEEVTGFVAQSLNTFAERGFGLWVVLDKESGDFCGVCGFMDKDGTPDLLFSVEPEYQGKGLATESGARVIAYACAELGIRQIVATVDKPNLDSIRVLEKLGMQRTEEKLVSGNALLFYSYVAVV